MKNERKEELKDEMKNRISLALKDPILQQGFEIICKENAELKEKLNISSCQNCRCNNKSCPNDGSCKNFSKWEGYKNPQLTKAKEIIKKFSEFVNNDVEYDPEHPQEHTNLWNKLCEEAEQFLNSEVEK